MPISPSTTIPRSMADFRRIEAEGNTWVPGGGWTLTPPVYSPPAAAAAAAPAAAVVAPTPLIVTGIEPSVYEAILYGKEKPLFIGGQGLIGGRPNEGVFWGGTQTNPTVSFIAFHAEAANPTGTRTITDARLRGKSVAYDGSGNLTDAALVGGSVQFRTGTPTQLPFDQSIIRYGPGAIAYRNGILSCWTNIPVAAFGGIVPMPSIEVSDSSFGDPADGITRQDAIEVILRYSRLADSEFEVSVPGSDPCWLVGSKSTLLEFLQRLRGMFVHWNITYSDKLYITDPTNFDIAAEITRGNYVTGSMRFTKNDPLIIPRKKNYTYFDQDRDFEPNVVSAQEDIYPQPATSSVNETSVELPLITTAAQATADVHVSLYEELAARSAMEATLQPSLFAVEAGDVVRFADHEDINFGGRLRQTEHNFATYRVDINAVEVLNCGADPDDPPPTVEYITHYESGAIASTYTYTGVDIAGGDCLLVITGGGITNNRTITAITVNGDAMDIHANVNGLGTAFADPALAIASLVIPAGETATVQLSFSGLCDGSFISITLIKDYDSATPTDTAQASVTLSNPAVALDVSEGGVIIAAYCTNGGGLSAVTWTGLATEDFDKSIATHGAPWWGSQANEAALTAEVGRAISVTGPSVSRELLVAASWR